MHKNTLISIKLSNCPKLLRNLNSQSSLEYLVIIALSLGIILPAIYLFYIYSSESNVQLFDSQINQIGKDMIDTAGVVYFSGKGAKITMELNVPSNVKGIFIQKNRELVINSTTLIGDVEAVFFSSVNITSDDASEECSINGNCKLIVGSGLNKIKFLSLGKQVVIGRVAPISPPTSSNQGVCQNAENGGLCGWLDFTYGEGYEALCCSEHGLCCS